MSGTVQHHYRSMSDSGATLLTLSPQVLAWFAVATYRLYFHPLSTVPGPKLWAISILPWWWYTWRGTCVYEVKNLHDKYGKTVRIGPNEVSSISANIWKDVYGHRKSGGKSYDKDPRFLRPTKTGTTDLLSAADEDHARWRRTLSHAFSDGSLRNQEAVVKHYVDLLIKNLRAKADGQERIDMVSWYNFTTFDVIGDLAFGKSFNCLEKGGYHPFVELVIQIMPHTIMNQLAQFMPLLYPLRDYFVPASIMKDSLAMMKWAEDTAFERIDRDPVERDDFMSFILRHKDENLMTRDEMVENSTILIVGGSETTASVLSGTTYYLATNRPVYNKLVNEIRGTLEKEEDITIQRVNALPYLVAVFNEGMRLYPALVEGSPRNVPKGGEFVDGFWMPEGVSTHTFLSFLAHMVPIMLPFFGIG